MSKPTTYPPATPEQTHSCDPSATTAVWHGGRGNLPPLLFIKLFIWYNLSKFHLNNLKSRSKKIILLFLTFSVIGGVVFLMLKLKKEPEIKTVAEVKVVTSPMEAMVLDSDNDGLKDWEETLWKLDPHKTDTNEDGVPDAEEVKKRISQIDADALKKDSTNDIIGSQYADDTETDTISKKLFAEYINLKQSGNFNEETINATANRLVEEQLNNKKVTVYYSAKDIKTFPSENKALLKTYGNSLASIRAKYVKLYLQNPLTKEGEVIDLVNPDFLKRLVRISDNFKNMAKEMSRLAVPKDLANNHIEILNNYMANSDGLKEMSKMGTDPVMAMVGVQRQTEAEANEKPLFSIVAKNIFQSGVVYSENEPGYSLSNI